MLARFRLTGGQAGDSPEALPLLDELKPASLAADKAYDSNAILQHLQSAGTQAVIPSRGDRPFRVKSGGPAPKAIANQ